MQNFSREDKIIFAAAGVLLVGAIVGIAYAAAKDKPAPKKDYGLRVGPQCASHEIVDRGKVEETVSALVQQKASTGPVDPFTVTSEWIRLAASGNCKAYPEQTRNPGEAILYQEIFYIVIATMQMNNFISDDMVNAYLTMVDAWAASQGAEAGLGRPELPG